MGLRTGSQDGLLGPGMKIGEPEECIGHGREFWVLEGGMGPPWRSRSGAGPLGHRMVVWTLIRDWILDLRFGAWDGLLNHGTNVWGLDV